MQNSGMQQIEQERSASTHQPGVTFLRTFGGQMRGQIQSHDWSRSALGSRNMWPKTLNGYVNMILHMPTPAIIFWGETQTQIYNDGYAVIMGPKRHPKYLGAPFCDCWPDTYPTIYPWMRRVLDHGEVVEVDRKLIPVTRHGFVENAYFSFTFTPLHDDDGNIAGVLQVVTEVTQAVLTERARREAQTERRAGDAAIHALAQSERRIKRELQLALRCGQMATWYVDMTTNRATISVEVARIFGVPYVADEDVGSVIDRVIHPDDRSEANRILSEAIRNRAFYSHEYRVVWPNGEERWVLAQGDYARDVSAENPAYAGVILDITERKLAEEKLKAALNLRDEFLSIASHELNTPLTSLKLQAQMAVRAIARKDSPKLLSERLTKFIEHTDRQTDRLARLVSDMLDISRIRTGKLAVRREHVVLSTLTAEVIDRLHPAMAAANTPVTFLCSERVEGTWDQLRLEQVVTNLLTNAMRYGGKKPVTVELSREDDTARLKVTDQGLGIAPQALEVIFSRFERQVTPSEVSGLGLGLYITRSIVSLHGGRIWAESEGVGLGSTFVVELPTSC